MTCTFLLFFVILDALVAECAHTAVTQQVNSHLTSLKKLQIHQPFTLLPNLILSPHSLTTALIMSGISSFIHFCTHLISFSSLPGLECAFIIIF